MDVAARNWQRRPQRSYLLVCLSDDAVRQVLMYLPCEEVQRLSLVCADLRATVEYPATWEFLFMRDAPDAVQ